MKNLKTYINEELESDNLIWLLDEWFRQKDDEKQEFINIVIKCQTDNGVNNVEKYIDDSKYLKTNYQQLVDFLNDDLSIKENPVQDYIYQFKEILKQIIGNKGRKNKYIKNN